jgi:hypothetical protein
MNKTVSNKKGILALKEEYERRIKEIETELEYEIIDVKIEYQIKYQEYLTLSNTVKDLEELLK